VAPGELSSHGIGAQRDHEGQAGARANRLYVRHQLLLGLRRERRLSGGKLFDRLAEQFKEQAALHRTNPEIPPPPTTNVDSLKLWSVQWAWVARIALWEREQEAIRVEELRRQTEVQARDDAKLLHSVGAGALGVAALVLNDLVDPATGTLKRPVQPRDLAPIAKVGIDCLAAAGGASPDGAGDPRAALAALMEHAPEDVRQRVLAGMRSLCEWSEQHKGHR
jgi:hypothetical protein